MNFDARVKNSDTAQPRVTNVKTPIHAWGGSKMVQEVSGPQLSNKLLLNKFDT